VNVDRLWYGRTIGARLARALLSPLSGLYRGVVSLRNELYDHSLLGVHQARIPVVSVGNVTVGGTGKTPFSAYLVERLVAAEHHPAVVMRGYGEDENHLHARMNPGVPVVRNRDRAAGIDGAAAAGADVVVLDDGFQHRRAGRDLDIVLVGAEKWGGGSRLLPAGPFREPLTSLERADLIVVTQKSASDAAAAAVARAIAARHRVTARVVIARLEPRSLVADRSGKTLQLDALRGERVFAIAGIGDPESFFAQLGQLGAVVTERRFRDHHSYSAEDARRLAAQSVGHKYVVTTEKDAVKLSRLWPANGTELWYLSQAVRLTDGESAVAAALAKLFPRATSIA
jgi:tetraacyldisaccharide 4'-kinase